MIPPNLSKKRIVLLTDCLADLAGGAEKQIYELARGLDKNKFEVHVVSLDCWGQAPRQIIEASGSQMHVFRVVRIYGLTGLIQGLRFYRFLKNNRIDILLTYHFSSDMWGTFWGHLAGVKKIMSNRRDMGFLRNKYHVAVYKLINHWVNKIVTVSASIKEMVIHEEGVGNDRFEVIYNGVELPDRKPQDPKELRIRLGLKNNDIVIMHVANLKPVKGHKYLLKAFAGISTLYPHVKLILVGRDELNGQLQDMTEGLNISDKVLFLGKRDDVQSLLNLADICILPSLSEGMSNSILEYMAAQKPVIATRVGGNPELIRNGFNGLLVEKENTEQLKDALLVLINDRGMCLDMGLAGYERVKKEFSMPAMLAHYEHLFSGIKVLHFISSKGMYGAENVLLNIAQNFNNDEYVSVVSAIEDSREPHLQVIEKAREMGLPVKIFKSKGRFDAHVIRDLRAFLVKENIDILHTHTYKADIIGALASSGLNIFLIATAHGFTNMDNKVSIYEKMDRWFLKRYFDCVVVVTCRILPDLSMDKKRIIQNGVPMTIPERKMDQIKIREQYGVKDTDILIATVGRLSYEKNQILLLEAFKNILSNKSNIKLMIIGEGPQEAQLKEYIEKQQLNSSIILTGFIKNVRPFYEAMDIFVLSSITEGIPMTILEAMVHKVPVLATDVGGVNELVRTRETGILINSNDVQDLSANLDILIENAGLRTSLAQTAHDFVNAHFSIDRMISAYDNTYREALNSSRN